MTSDVMILLARCRLRSDAQ